MKTSDVYCRQVYCSGREELYTVASILLSSENVRIRREGLDADANSRQPFPVICVEVREQNHQHIRENRKLSTHKSAFEINSSH